jgi:ribosome-binding protein aMBF1 (putative translation factor)
MEKRTTARELHEEWMRNPAYVEAYAALDEELALADAFIRARAQAALTQEQVAERMGTTQAVIARLESGR